MTEQGLRLAWAALASLLAVLLALGLARAGVASVEALAYPFEIDFSEGTTAAQVQGLMAGELYAPLGPGQLMTYCYAPIYLAISAMAANLTGDILLAGRLVSLVSAVLWSGVLGLICFLATPSLDRSARVIGGLVASASVWSFLPVWGWAPLYHVDFTAILFAAAGMACVLAAWRRPVLLVAATLLFLAGLFTKQTTIAAPLAALAACGLLWPRRAIACLSGAAALGLLCLWGLVEATSPAALDHLVRYNTHGVRLARLASLILLPAGCLLSAVLVGLWLRGAAPALARLWRARAAIAREEGAQATLVLYLGIASLSTLGIMKIGANWNYTIEMLGLWAVIGGILAARLSARWKHGGLPHPGWALGFAALALVQVAFPWPSWQDIPQGQAAADARAVFDFVKTVPGPILSEDPTTVIAAGRRPAADIFLLSQLAMAGMVPAGLIDDPIVAKDYGAIIMTSRSPEVWLPSTQAAIDRSYALAHTLGRYRIYVPAR